MSINETNVKSMIFSNQIEFTDLRVYFCCSINIKRGEIKESNYNMQNSCECG